MNDFFRLFFHNFDFRVSSYSLFECKDAYIPSEKNVTSRGKKRNQPKKKYNQRFRLGWLRFSRYSKSPANRYAFEARYMIILYGFRQGVSCTG